jgi:hypothetical protein
MAETGAVICEKCPKGTYSDEIGSTSCRPCQKGK